MELFVALAAIKLPGLCLHVDGEKWAMQQQLVIIMTWRDEGQVLRWGGGGVTLLKHQGLSCPFLQCSKIYRSFYLLIYRLFYLSVCLIFCAIQFKVCQTEIAFYKMCDLKCDFDCNIVQKIV